MQQQNPVRTAIAGLSHDHVIWLLRNWQRDDLEIVGFWEPDSVLAQRYAERYAFPLERVYGDLDELSREALGESVPLVALFDWLRGRPWAGAPSRDTAAGFEQLGWEVDRRKAGEGLIVVTRQAPAVTLRVKLDAS